MEQRRRQTVILKKIFAIATASILCIASGSAMAASEVIGRVKTLQGEVSINGASGSRAAEAGSVVRRGDTLVTGSDGSVGVTFRDDSRTSLGPNSEMQMTEFKFDPARQEYSFVSKMFRGTMLFVSGLISKLSPETAQVETPTATLGIRGTRFLLQVDGE
ncbi:MAG: FecR domain-containing protein [Pseudomonadota bacterium]